MYFYGVTTNTSFRLSRMLGRIASLQRAYLRLSLKEHLNIEPEWYFFLHSIDSRKSTRKTDIISYNLLFEPTTGIDILNRMIRAGLLTEKIDPSDKRARLLSITKEGKTTLRIAQQLAQQIADKFFGNMPAALKEELLRHLDAIEDSYSGTTAIIGK